MVRLTPRMIILNCTWARVGKGTHYIIEISHHIRWITELTYFLSKASKQPFTLREKLLHITHITKACMYVYVRGTTDSLNIIEFVAVNSISRMI